MRFNPLHYSSHMPMLMKAMSLTVGDVLELGMGHYSTPLLHWLCEGKRKLLSVENDPRFFATLATFQSEWHDCWLIEDWEDPRLDKRWDVVFIDQAPAITRVASVKKFQYFAKIIVLHDTDWRQKKHYPGMDELIARFKYARHDLNGKIPGTSILSNYVEV